MSAGTLSLYYNPINNTFEITSAGVNDTILKAFGARVQKGKGKAYMTARLADVKLMQDAGYTVKAADEKTVAKFTEMRRAEALDKYLATAQGINKECKHASWGRMLPHQHVGAAYLMSRDRASLVLTPRLGKTVCSVVAADEVALKAMRVGHYEGNKRGGRVLVVAPLTILTSTWVNGIKEWSEDGRYARTHVLRGKGLHNAPADTSWFITNPETIINNLEWFKDFCLKMNINVIILDEAILYKNHKAKRTIAMKELGEYVQRVWELTGNPLGEFQDDMYGQLQVLRPDVFTSYWRFAETWTITQKMPWATVIVGNKNPDRFREYLSDIMLSRTPKEVPVLPDLKFELVPVEPSDRQHEMMDELNDTMALKMDNGEELEITARIALLTRLQQVISCPSALGVNEDSTKLKATLDILEYAEKPAIVWFQYRDAIERFRLAAEAKGYEVGVIHGGVREQHRNEYIEQFQAGGIHIICVQLRTGKFGLNLTAAKTVIYYDRSPDLDDWVQSTHRVRHVKHDNVAAGYVLHSGYTDHLIDKIIERKVTSLESLSLSDLLEFTKPTTGAVRKPKARKTSAK